MDSQISGGVGDDYLNGGNGNDLLAGGNGNDNALGEAGNDLIRGDTVRDNRNTYQANGDDSEPDGLHGGSGIDTISFATAVTPGFRDEDFSVNLSLYPGFPAEDQERGVYVSLSDGIAHNGVDRYGGGKDIVQNFENVIGSAFSDFIQGSSSNNVLVGSGGADVLLGGPGSDVLYGGAESDHLDGQGEPPGENSVGDELDGGTGNYSNSSNYCTNAEAGETNCDRGTPGVVAVLQTESQPE